MDTVVLHHLGYSLLSPINEVLEQGFDVVVHYFCDPWWKGDRDSIKAMDKTYKRRQLRWFKEFAPGLLLGLLSERWNDLARVCAWIEARIRPEYLGDDIEPELVHVYRSLAAGLRPERMPGLDNVEAKIRKCRLLRPKLLFQAWEAARKGDQEAFNAAFLKSLEHFESNFKPTGDFYAPMHWIAPHHSVVGLAAMRLGMELPELSPMQDAVVIRRESLGLADT